MAKIRGRKPESVIQEALVKMLRDKGWFVMISHGNMFQAGWPDLFLCHKAFGYRWIDVKCPDRYSLTPAQKKMWPKLSANGSGVWILTADTEAEYNKLFKPANWHYFWKEAR